MSTPKPHEEEPTAAQGQNLKHDTHKRDEIGVYHFARVLQDYFHGIIDLFSPPFRKNNRFLFSVID